MGAIESDDTQRGAPQPPTEAAAGAVAREVDARGRACPIPVLELAKAIPDVPVGARVRLLATDPAAKVDVPVWCRMQRHVLHAASDQDGVWVFEVERRR